MSGVVYIGIGNSDDKLSQREWVVFQLDVKQLLVKHDARLIGEWHSYPDSIFQNACFAVDVDDDRVPELKGGLAALAKIHRQDSIAWAVALRTEFLGK